MKRLVYSFIFASLVGMSSCNDFDVPVTDRLTEEDVWKDETLVTGALANLYDKLQVEQNSAYFEGWDVWNVSLTTASDEGTGAFQAGDLGTGDVVRATFNDEWFGLWADTYKSIRGCNVFLEKLEASAMEEKLKNAYNAEARFLRAFHYFNLVKRYGGVPIVTDVQSYTGPEDLPALQVPRDKEQAVWDFIINEVDEITSELPVSRDANSRTRITRYGAFALPS